MPELSIIIPTQNDAAALPATLEALHRLVVHHSLSVEILLIDQESTDATLAKALDAAKALPALHIRVLIRRNLMPGMGGVVRYANAFAAGRFCVLLSADGSDPVELVPTFLRHLRAGKHLVQCSRYSLDEHTIAVSPKFRVYQKVYRTLTRILLGSAPADTTYGFRAYDRIFVQALGLSAKRFNVCPEMTFKVALCGGQIEYVPGKPRNPDQGGQSKFLLKNEIWGYAYVLMRAWMHRIGIRRWF
jgi:glycosyltransferase involved in cell wall biosynthesis